MRQIFPKNWFSIGGVPSSSDIITFGRLDGRPDRRTSETSLHSQLRHGTYHYAVENFTNGQGASDKTSKDLEQGIRIKVTA
jgi:hypothetical protein